MFENTARLQATGENLSYWSHPIFCNIWKYDKIVSNEDTFTFLKPPNMWQCLKIRKGRVGKLTEATQYLAMFESTTKLPATGENLKLLSHQQGVEKYHKIAGRGGKFKYLKPPDILQVWKHHKIASNGGNFNLLKPPKRQCWKIPQDCRPRGKI